MDGWMERTEAEITVSRSRGSHFELIQPGVFGKEAAPFQTWIWDLLDSSWQILSSCQVGW